MYSSFHSLAFSFFTLCRSFFYFCLFLGVIAHGIIFAPPMRRVCRERGWGGSWRCHSILINKKSWKICNSGRTKARLCTFTQCLLAINAIKVFTSKHWKASHYVSFMCVSVYTYLFLWRKRLHFCIDSPTHTHTHISSARLCRFSYSLCHRRRCVARIELEDRDTHA